MKKAIIGIVAITLILLTVTSCKKTTTVNGGSWTFKDSTSAAINYTVTSCIADVSQNPFQNNGVDSNINTSLAAVCQSNGAYGSVVFTFFQFPKVSGVYTITSNQFPDYNSNEIAINMILSTGSSYAQKNYNPSATANGVTATVTVMSNGYVKISLPAIEMVNYYEPNDSGILTANVIQTAPAQ